MARKGPTEEEPEGVGRLGGRDTQLLCEEPGTRWQGPSWTSGMSRASQVEAEVNWGPAGHHTHVTQQQVSLSSAGGQSGK